MAIHVTPIPSTIDLTAPAFTLGTTNTAGAAVTAVSSNSTLLVYDATVPSSIAAGGDTAAAGSATVSARRDHLHGSTAVVAAASAAEVLAKSSDTVYVTPGRAEYHPYMPKAGGRCTSGGTVQDGSFGISGITRTDSPHIYYKWLLDPDFSDTDYFGLVSQNSGSVANRDVWCCGPSSLATTGFNIEAYDSSGDAFVDAAMSVIAWGTIP